MVVFNRVASAKGFRLFLEELDIKGVVFVIKPDWSSGYIFTSAKTLDWLFSALEGRIKVIEGYSAWRNELNTGSELKNIVTPTNARSKWSWIKEQDKWFLKFSGIDKILEKHDAEYINITEEVWSMRALDPDEVRDFVDSKYGMVVNQEMYNFVPRRIYELRGSTLISLNVSRHVNGRPSLSTKNLFGLIPEPARYGKWHGRNDSKLSQNIVDINKIYRSIFSPCYWINKIKGKNVFVGSKNSVESDAITAKLMGLNPDDIDYIRRTAKIFGGYDKNILNNIPNSY